MRILDRYILSQLGLPFLLCLSGFLIFWLSGDILANLEDFQKENVKPFQIVQYYLLKLPGFLDLLGPIVFLLSLLYGFIQMTRHHETTAMRACGISLWRLAFPVLIISILFGVLSFVYREIYYVSFESTAENIKQGSHATQQTTTDQSNQGNKSQLYYWNEKADRRWDIAEYKNENQLIFSEVNVEWAQTNGFRKVVFAPQAYFETNKWVFINASSYNVQPNGEQDLIPEMHDRLQIDVATLPETPDFLLSQFKISRIDDVRDARLALFNIREIQNLKKLFPDMSEEHRTLLNTKLHIQLASGFTYFVVAMIAIPLGSKPGRRDVFIGVAISMAVCFTYFVIQRVSAPLGYSGKVIPWVAAWIPNIIFGIYGLILMVRSNNN